MNVNCSFNAMRSFYLCLLSITTSYIESSQLSSRHETTHPLTQFACSPPLGQSYPQAKLSLQRARCLGPSRLGCRDVQNHSLEGGIITYFVRAWDIVIDAGIKNYYF